MESYSSYICRDCWGEIVFISRSKLDFHAVVEYNHTIKRLIHIFKYKSPWKLCDLFVNWMSITHDLILKDADLIIPVPMHKYKLMIRGYNHASVLVKRLAQRYCKEYNMELLLRIRQIKSQSSLGKQERQTNVIGSVSINKSSNYDLKAKKILIIDDVITTGATLMECKRVLEASGAESVKTLCIAMTKYE